MSDFALYVAAIVCFVLAAVPPIFKVNLQWQWLAFAFLVASLL